ncbi:MAG: NAD(P)H-binding protein [Anaerolineaceae bacterium]|nr:NAD(P)H-binding protein [Anaerolineaceae bacterium]
MNQTNPTAQGVHAVTGAFGYSGKYIAARLLAQGQTVRTLTNSPRRRNPFQGQIEAHPFHFDQPELLVESLQGVRVLYNTYWVRFNASGFRHSQAVENTLTLFRAARAAGVERIVHVSITNPSLESDLEYFRGKARLEQALIDSGLSYAILRPTVLFGEEDILINNIAWVLRRLPVFGVFGDGQYRLQPIYVDDLAALAVEQGRTAASRVIDATGPETFTYRQLVRAIGAAIGKERPLIPVPPRWGYLAGWALGQLKGDVLITWEEVLGLTSGLLYTPSPPAGTTHLTDWLAGHAASLGSHYASELARRKDLERSYQEISGPG